MHNDKIKVLYIAGFGRNGSTLLSRLLGELDGFLSIGEGTRALFNTILRSDIVPCGCGSRVPDCPFWKDIISNIDHDDENFSRNRVRVPYIPLLLSPIKPPAFQEQLEKFLATVESTFRLITKRANCRVIVDSSKNPPQAYILSQIPGIDLYVVHLVRDPRGVVHSLSRPKGYIPKVSTRRSILLWSTFNLFSEPLRFYAKKYLWIRYEDFVRNPSEIVKKIVDHVDEKVSNLDFLQGTQARLSVQHVLASNPDKYTTGQITIKEQSWHLPWYKQAFVSLATLPLLHWYRYSSL